MKSQYINFTPIPAQVPRQLAIEILQSHGEIITVNPLVLEYHPVKAPRDCPNDEYYSTWYEITERIQFVPGFKKMGSSKVTFRGCFHDMPWGVQTHMYVPMGVDLRNKWQIRGTQPGEPPEPRELGSGAPSSGLYLREEVEIRCNPLALSFVKKEMKAASKTMVERMLKKAELLEDGVLQAMFENGKLKTYNPNDRASMMLPPGSPPPASPGLNNRWRPESMGDVRMSTYSSYQLQSKDTPNQLGQIANPDGNGHAIEMPGDYLYPSDALNQNKTGSDRHSIHSGSDRSPNQPDHRWSFGTSDRQSNANSQTSRPTSLGNSPNSDGKNFTAELPGSGHMDVKGPRSAPATQQAFAPQTYNPQSYARFAANGY